MTVTPTPTASLASSERGRALTILAAILLMLVVDWLPEPAPLERAGDVIALTPNGKACLAILAFAITLWVTEAIPFAVTALFVLLLVPIFGIADYATTVRAGFGNTLVTFFIGVLFLSTGFTRSGLGTRLVLHMLRVVGTRTDRVLLGFLVIGAMLSMWITDMAVAAVLLPLGVGLLKEEQLRAGADDLLRLRSPDRRHRHAGRRWRQPGRGGLPARAGRGGDLVRALDGLRVPGRDPDDPGLLADSAARVSAGDRAPAAGAGGNRRPHRGARPSDPPRDLDRRGLRRDDHDVADDAAARGMDRRAHRSADAGRGAGRRFAAVPGRRPSATWTGAASS
ncbi:MAG: anion permease [Acidobacteria bacterium]|nr:anion permease [Acidobacteriota bacterium]